MKLQPWDPDLRSLVDRINNGDIDLQPDFQRQEVWPRAKQRKLIDTILRDWSIPPVHLVVTGDNKLEVLDGQQRLAAIRDFLNDKVRVDGGVPPVDLSISKLDNLRYSKLPPDVKRRIDQYALRAFKITDYQPEEPSELFYRLNQPTSLTAGEKRNSLYGGAREQLRTAVKRFTDHGNGVDTIGFSNSRMAYDDVIARVMFFLSIASFGRKASEVDISNQFRNMDGFSSDVEIKCSSAIDLFSDRRIFAGKIKLNKASLLSWLLFFCREGAGSTDIDFLRYFETLDTSDVEINAALRAAKLIFVDRASLRVTDVSSVVYRDFCLWFVYSKTHDGDVAYSVLEGYAEAVDDAFGSDGDAEQFEMVLEQLLRIDQWASF